MEAVGLEGLSDASIGRPEGISGFVNGEDGVPEIGNDPIFDPRNVNALAAALDAALIRKIALIESFVPCVCFASAGFNSWNRCTDSRNAGLSGKLDGL